MAYTTLPQAGVNFAQAYAVATAVTSTSGLDQPSPPWAVGTWENGSTGGEWVFCIAGGTVAANDFVIITPATFTATAITNTLALAAIGGWVGVAGAAVTVGQFFWVNRGGYSTSANVATSAAAFTVMHTTTTAGRLSTTSTGSTTATVAGVYAQATAAANIANVMMNRPLVTVAD